MLWFDVLFRRSTANAILYIKMSYLIDEIKIHHANENIFKLQFKYLYKAPKSIEEIGNCEYYDLRNSIFLSIKNWYPK